MEKLTSLFLIIALFLTALAPLPLSAGKQDGERAGVLVVKLESGSSDDVFENLALEQELLFDEIYRVEVPDVVWALDLLKRSSAVKFVHEDRFLQIQLNANDPLYVLDRQELSKQWYLPKIEMHRAWNLTTGSPQVTVAVVDTGIDGRHEDLNRGQVVGGFLNYCQIEDQSQQNGCLVRISGTVVAGSNSDDNGHGTIVAGILGATANNQKGITGINWNVRLMPIKVLNSSGSGAASDVAAGIRWAADNGADIINLSIGGPGLAGLQVLQDAISYAFNKGILIVAAAGNDVAITGGNLNANPVSPVCMDAGENMVVGVAAVDSSDRKAKFSNFGSNCIDISAPGTGTFIDRQNKQGLVSTYFDPSRPGEHDLYVYAVGTSLATPMVAGTAALMIAQSPHLDARAIRDRLIASVDDISHQNTAACGGRDCGRDLGLGRLNAFKALSVSTEFSEGQVVANSAGAKYLIESGLKRPISEFVFNQRFFGANVIVTDQSQLDRFPTGGPVSPVDGTLIKSLETPVVYLVEGSERRPLSLPAFISKDFQFSQVVSLPRLEVLSYPLGDEVEVKEGVLLKSVNHPAVYILENGERRLLSFFVFQQRGFDQQRIAAIPDTELNQYPFNPQAPLYPPLDGTLMRGGQNPTVFMIENGRRRGLNLNAFRNRGFRFEDVVILPQTEVDRYERSDTIIE